MPKAGEAQKFAGTVVAFSARAVAKHQKQGKHGGGDSSVNSCC